MSVGGLDLESCFFPSVNPTSKVDLYRGTTVHEYRVELYEAKSAKKSFGYIVIVLILLNIYEFFF